METHTRRKSQTETLVIEEISNCLRMNIHSYGRFGHSKRHLRYGPHLRLSIQNTRPALRKQHNAHTHRISVLVVQSCTANRHGMRKPPPCTLKPRVPPQEPLPGAWPSGGPRHGSTSDSAALPTICSQSGRTPNQTTLSETDL